ncbi:hypothetical protein MRX96_027588 [Rhipicephalus microplus]
MAVALSSVSETQVIIPTRQAVELSLVGVVNDNECSVVELLGQQGYLRWVTCGPLNFTDHAQRRVTEKSHLNNSTFPFRPAKAGRLCQLITDQQLLESEMCFHHCITGWSIFILLPGPPCE